MFFCFFRHTVFTHTRYIHWLTAFDWLILLQQSASGLGIDQNLHRYRAVSLRQHGFLVLPMALRVCQLKYWQILFTECWSWHCGYSVHAARAIFIRDGSLYVNLPCFPNDVLFLISYLSTMWFFKHFLFFLVSSEYDFIINIYKKSYMKSRLIPKWMTLTFV